MTMPGFLEFRQMMFAELDKLKKQNEEMAELLKLCTLLPTDCPEDIELIEKIEQLLKEIGE